MLSRLLSFIKYLWQGFYSNIAPIGQNLMVKKSKLLHAIITIIVLERRKNLAYYGA
jgi:hypothetical protein